MKVLVTGGAGFIGSVTCRALEGAGHVAAVFDDFSTGHEWAVQGRELYRGDLRDGAAIAGALRASRAEAVLHFAGRAVVPDSVRDPLEYFDVNVVGSLRLLEGMGACGVKRIVFSSSAAVYGEPREVPIPEEAPKAPINPYGRTKLQFEEILEDVRPALGLGSACLRYFNACGAAPEWGLGEVRGHETHLVPLVIRAARTGTPVTVCGTDYPTRDGSCIRDYVDVRDLADAHVRALERLEPGRGGIYNLGSERGTSVREVIDAVRRCLGRDVPFREGPRRAGDPPTLVASCARARAELGWVARRTLDDSIRAALEFGAERA